MPTTPTYSFDPTLAPTIPLDRARRLLFDTGEMTDENGVAVWHYSNEEVSGWITADGFNEGVAKLAQSLATKFAQEPVRYRDDGGVDYDFGPRIAQLNLLASQLRSNISREIPTGGAAQYMAGQLPDPTAGHCRGKLR